MRTHSKTRPAMLCAAALVCSSLGCSRETTRLQPISGKYSSRGVVTLYVVNYPLAYFAKRIGGEHASVVFPAPKEVDPAFWRPDAETITQYQQADLILLNGASYAKWTETAALPASKLVDTSAAFARRYIEVTDAVTHSHGPGGERAGAEIASTTWLDFQLAIAQAEAIRAALSKLQPEHESDFHRGFSELASDLQHLDEQLLSVAEGKTDRPLVFSHPVYPYLARRYRLRAKSVHWEADSAPTTRMIQELAELLQTHRAKSMVWEAAPSAENLQRLDELGLRSIVYNPCANVPEKGDFLEVMRRNVENLAAVLQE